MKRWKQTIGVLCCFTVLFAFSSVHACAMGFDAEKAYESIFVIYSGNSEGSGFAIGSNTVVTNAHVIDEASNIKLSTYSGETYKARVYLIDDSFDIAILSVDNSAFTPLSIGDSDNVRVGDDIYAIGAPKSMDYTLTKGVISNKTRRIGAYSYIQIDAAINSGNSGGPLLNDDGQVIGVNSLKVSDAEGIGLAIPMASVLTFLENNGVAVTDGRVADGETPFAVEPESPQGDSEDGQAEGGSQSAGSRHNEQDHTLVIAVTILLGVSVVLNIVLLVMLNYRRNKNKYIVPDPSERTDFDIDILE